MDPDNYGYLTYEEIKTLLSSDSQTDNHGSLTAEQVNELLAATSVNELSKDRNVLRISEKINILTKKIDEITGGLSNDLKMAALNKDYTQLPAIEEQLDTILNSLDYYRGNEESIKR